MEILSDLTETGKMDQINDFLEENLIEFGALEDAYITSRYVIREYKKREAEILFKIVKEIIENVI
jgi:HEPN domain-containing protein